MVTECEKRQIAKQREKTDTTQKIETTLGLTKERTVSGPDADRMEISKPHKQAKTLKAKMAPGSEWLKIKKLTGRRRVGKKPLRRRYQMELKGITQYYPLNKQEMAVDE